MHSMRMICEVVIAVSSARLFSVATKYNNDAALSSTNKTAKESVQGPDNYPDFHEMQDMSAVRQLRVSTHSRNSYI